MCCGGGSEREAPQERRCHHETYRKGVAAVLGSITLLQLRLRFLLNLLPWLLLASCCWCTGADCGGGCGGACVHPFFFRQLLGC